MTTKARKPLPFPIETMQALATEAGLEAIARLKAKGIPVHGRRNGVLVEELPDGTTRPLYETELPQKKVAGNR